MALHHYDSGEVALATGSGLAVPA